ncbi:unnamed protein product [Moneuplotes crassus]|uniref:Uncharacterized protein n=1 Tax=Euplotes crassus TaxID=5936 RepID=A0AAD1UTP7_EUPCR|nr:unnamed protein product [Moneuplotes crassus]
MDIQAFRTQQLCRSQSRHKYYYSFTHDPWCFVVNLVQTYFHLIQTLIAMCLYPTAYQDRTEDIHLYAFIDDGKSLINFVIHQ